MKRSESFTTFNEACSAFDREIERLKFTKKTRGDLSAGFRDGFRSAMTILEKAGHQKIEEG